MSRRRAVDNDIVKRYCAQKVLTRVLVMGFSERAPLLQKERGLADWGVKGFFGLRAGVGQRLREKIVGR